MDNSVKKLDFITKVKSVSLIKNDRKKLIALITAVLGALLIFLSIPQKSGSQSAGSSDGALSEYKRELEAELSELCSSVSGAGRCKVKVSFSEGARSEYRGTNKISETPPRVLGITIISEGGDKPEVKAALTECMSAMFNIKANRIAVLKMKN